MGKLGNARRITVGNEEFLAISESDLERLKDFFNGQNERVGARGEKTCCDICCDWCCIKISEGVD